MLSSPALRRLALALLLPSGAALAGPGHDHDHGPEAAPVAAALPRFTATSEAFELVGVVDGRQMTLYLDHAPTNAPVQGARLALSIGDAQLAATAQGEGEFVVTLAQPLKAGVTPVTATVTAGSEADLLAGEIDIGASTDAGAHTHRRWTFWAAWAGVATAVLAALLMLRRRRGKRFGEPA